MTKTILHVPANMVTLFQSTSPWKDFASIVALTDDDPKPTGIASVSHAKQEYTTYFDLNGRKLTDIPIQKGVYINNGKKVVVK